MPAGDPHWIQNTFVNPNVWFQSVNSNVWVPSPFVTHNLNKKYFSTIEFSFTKKTQIQESFTFIDTNAISERRLSERWTCVHEETVEETVIEENINWKAEGF